MKSKLLHIISGLLLLTACHDFLDVKPIGKLIPKDVEEFENLLNNTNTVDYQYMDNNRGSLFGTLGDNLEISENSANYNYTATHVNIDRFAAYTFKLPYQNPEYASYFWEWGTYRAAGIFNNVIEGIESVRKAASDVVANQLIAQAKAGRAWSYLTMCLLYGPIYNPAGPNDTKTIPYRTSASPTTPNPELATTAEVFAKVKEDLDFAVKYAPQNTANPSRTDIAAAQALMAYYYMFTRDFAKMYEYADMAWKSALKNKGSVDNLIYDFNLCYYEENPSASPSPGTDVEVNLELKGQDEFITKSYGRENLFYRIAPSGGTSANGYPSAEFLNLFDQGKDLRYKLFALKDLGYNVIVEGKTYDDGIVRLYFRGSKININQGITYPELLLMRAEAAARLNKLTDALADLNTLRHYRYVNKDGAVTDLENGQNYTQDQLLEEILKERRRELPICSFQRLLDLKRFTLDTGKPWCKTVIEHHVGKQTYSAPLNSEYFIMPIPNNIIEYNPQWGLTQDTRPYHPKG